MSTRYQDAASGPQRIALGLWDFVVEAYGRPWAHSVQTSVRILFFPQILYSEKKPKSKQTFPFSSNPFICVLHLRSLAQPHCSFRSVLKNDLCSLLGYSTTMTL